MFDILFALLGIAFIGCKLLSDAGASYKMDCEIDERHKQWDRWRELVTDCELERELEFFLYQNPIEASARAKSLCPCIPSYLHDRETYLQILMAEHGKIMRHDSIMGVAVKSYSTKEYTPEKILRQRRIEFHNYIMWLKEFLETNGAPRHDMYFLSLADTKPHLVTSECEEEILKFGSYKWAPQCSRGTTRGIL